ncbi:DUF5615 family PIN-like protein [Sorangium sp. So ce1024]|uniref:DUF5615 family PIN-like protein n=1 Tax=unclassified Sorangium TaxID=2621164 RepID=UPI003EFFE7B9
MILADENIAAPIVERLRADGVTVLQVSEIAPTIADSEVLRLAAEHNAIVPTDDKDSASSSYGKDALTGEWSS